VILLRHCLAHENLHPSVTEQLGEYPLASELLYGGKILVTLATPHSGISETDTTPRLAWISTARIDLRSACQ
jgi:hypothetical protein